jgi:hypothetical protein
MARGCQRKLKHHQRQDAFPDHPTGQPQIELRTAFETMIEPSEEFCEWPAAFLLWPEH